MHKKYKTRIGAAMEEFLDLQKERSFCAADACHYMEQREIAVNITTVYRHLEQLVKDGILVKFKTADSDNQRYRLAGMCPGVSGICTCSAAGAAESSTWNVHLWTKSTGCWKQSTALRWIARHRR